MARPLNLCLQAYDQGVLQGDLNMVQVAALSLAKAYQRSEKIEEFRAKVSFVNDIVDLWMKLEHPNAYEEVERARAMRQQEEKPDQALVADDMNEMLDQMLHLAGMS